MEKAWYTVVQYYGVKTVTEGLTHWNTSCLRRGPQAEGQELWYQCSENTGTPDADALEATSLRL